MNFLFSGFLHMANSVASACKQLMFAALASLIASTSLAVTESSGTVVGEVTMHFREAYIVSADGKATPVSVGAPVHVSDTIETGTGSVHVRFIDNELLAVRPYSTLEIQRFDYDPQAPQNSVITFVQQEGVGRYISGKGAEAAKQNFRLNTPIAAIGVRGTDFVVSATDTSVRAFVNQGAIVVAPYSADCSAQAVGSCSQNAVELSSLSQQILEMNANPAGATVALLPANSSQTEQALAVAAAVVPEESEENETADKDLYTDTVTSRAVNVKLASSAVRSAREFTPDQTLSVAALTTNSQLVWGRWYESSLENERMTVSHDIATQNGRQVVIGSSLHALFRAENGSTTLKPGLGVLSFDLTQAQAQYKLGGKTELMDVLGGNLQLDFDRGRYATGLQLSHAATGKIEFRSNGIVDPFGSGIFQPDASTAVQSQSMAGAVSLDGKEAGYTFEMSVGAGNVEGVTLWNRQP